MPLDLLDDIDAFLGGPEGELVEPPMAIEQQPATPFIEVEVEGFGVVEFPADTPPDVMKKALDDYFRPDQGTGTDQSGVEPPEVRASWRDNAILLEDDHRARLQKVAETLSRTPDIGLGEYAAALQVEPEDRQLLLEMARRQYEKDQTTQKIGYLGKAATTFTKAAIKTPLAWAKLAGAVEDLTPEQELFRQRLEAVRQGTDPTIDQDLPWGSPEKTSLQVAGMVPYMASTVAAYTSGKGVVQAAGAGG
jgi:hypothetical protein